MLLTVSATGRFNACHILLGLVNYGNMNEQEIKQFALKYRNGLIGNKSSHSMCWVVTQPLSLLLKEIGLDNEIVRYDIDSSRSIQKLDCEVAEHFCIKIGRKILDPTADQFGLDKVFFGSRPIWYADTN